MPNMSDKNFPHAHGSGRVVAAFQLSHPGSTMWDQPGTEYAPGAKDMAFVPPVLHDPTLTATYPYPESGPPSPPGLQKTFRQPYNATSVGVFVQGSGTRRLPYTETILPEVDSSISPPLNAELPATKIYPFEMVDKTVLGRTHAQVVCSAVGGDGEGPGYPEELSGAGDYAYYEVGLNWDLPDYKFEASVAGFNAANFANQKIASVQRAIQRTYWATASLATSALSEFHPKVTYGQPLPAQNFNEGPLDANLTSMASMDGYPAEIRGMATPYGAGFWDVAPSQSRVQPAYSPSYPLTDADFKTRSYALQTQVSAIVTRWKATLGPDVATVEFTLAPIVRIWCLLAAEPFPDPPAPVVAPRPIPRGGIGAYRFNPGIGEEPADISIFPGVNVQVIQKNTSATDNTDLPVYDLGSDWAFLNDPPSVPVIRRAAEPVFSFPTELKDED